MLILSVCFCIFSSVIAVQDIFNPVVLQATMRQGLSYERCSFGDSCAGNRTCQEIGSFGNSDCFEFSELCFCSPPTSLLPCVTSSECPIGEICAQRTDDLATICASETAIMDASFLGPAPIPAQPPSSGLSYDDCFFDTSFSDCLGTADCMDSQDEFQSCSRDSERCYCRPFGGGRNCLASFQCPPGEVCSKTPFNFESFPECVSAVAAQRWIAFEEITIKKSTGLTMDPCLQDKDCMGDRFCAWLGGFKVEECQERRTCACLPRRPPVCFSSSDCSDLNEACSINSLFFTPLCTSIEAANAYDWITRHGVDICPVLFKEDKPQPAVRLDIESPDEASFGYQKRPWGSGLSIAFNPLDSTVAQPAIAGGLPASERLKRYMVATVNPDGGFCSGVLISPRWIMSAAHCELTTGTRVYFGRMEINVFDRPSFFLSIKKVISNRRFDSQSQGYLFDISVAEINSTAPIGSLFMTLNGKHSIPGDDSPVRAIGYGIFNDTFEGRDDPIRVLQQVDLKTVSTAKCSEAENRLVFPANISSRLQLCSGIEREICSICSGDSGGPLITYENGAPLLVGIASTAVRCRTTEFPNIHSRVSGFIPWLLGTGADFKVNVGLSDSPPCKRGEVVLESMNVCIPCKSNETSFGDFSKKCSPCTMGFVQDTEDRSFCSCKGFNALGKGIEGDKCIECKAGFFSGGSDSTCERCPPGTTSKPGSSVCIVVT